MQAANHVIAISQSSLVPLVTTWLNEYTSYESSTVVTALQKEQGYLHLAFGSSMRF